MEEVEKQRLFTELKHFNRVNEETYRLLSALSYHLETTLETAFGRWEIFTKHQFVFPYFIQNITTPVDRFVAIFKGNSEFITSGSYDSLETVKANLQRLTEIFFPPKRRWLGIPLELTPENAQDYGYLRGLIFGCLLIGLDVSYSWFFKLKTGLLTGIIDFIRLVYEGNVGLAIGVGIALTGFYFGVLLIAVPIIYGQICVQRASRRENERLETQGELLEYEFGRQAEQSLAEEFNTILEEKRKEEIYQELRRDWPELDRAEFQDLYQRLVNGFVSPEDLEVFLKDFNRVVPSGRLEYFLQTVVKFRKASPVLEITLKPSENSSG
ncbi:MAG: hypothetical protein NC911_01145 [Candidatus Omnitrophica bacterium]|nr:hypothetical protein [Candidatus Omnitrophota bacterium]